MFRIFGPPGTGKTTTLINRVSESLSQGVPSNKIAFLSFTNKACNEARERAGVKFNLNPEKDLPWFKTIHSFSKHCMDERGKRCMEEKDVKEFALQVRLSNFGGMNTTDFEEKGIFRNSPVLSLIHRARVKKVSLREEYNDSSLGNMQWHEVEYISESYNNFKEQQRVYDFTDMLEMFLLDAKYTCPAFDLVLLDEAQDLSPLQWDIAHVLDTKAKKMYCAGDDDQAIYVWAGASPKEFIHLESGAEVLSQSYRVPKTPHKIAQSIIKQISKPNRFPKEYDPAEKEGEVVRLSGIPFDKMNEGNWLILAQCAFMLKEVEEEMRTHGYFFEKQGVPSVSVSALLAIKGWEKLRKGGSVDKQTAQKIYKMMSGNGKQIKRGKKAIYGDDLEMFSYEDLKENHGLLVEQDIIWREALNLIPEELESYIVSLLKKKEKLGEKPRISLSTIHGAKGAECDNVVVLTDISASSERETRYNQDSLHRLFYVAVTRTRESLFLLYPDDPEKSYLIV
tara:strand:- start:1941 stop:3464 length:1524 start_codon:yes stop_codon:yes gene_type:complete